MIHIFLHAIDDIDDFIYVILKLFSFLETNHRDQVSFLISNGI